MGTTRVRYITSEDGKRGVIVTRDGEGNVLCISLHRLFVPNDRPEPDWHLDDIASSAEDALHYLEGA